MHSTRYTILYHARSMRFTIPYLIQSTQYTTLYHIQSTQHTIPHHMHSTQYTILYHARSMRYTIPYHVHSTQSTILYHIQSTQYTRHCNISETGRRPCYVRSDHKYLSIYRWHSLRLRGSGTQLCVFLGLNFDLYEGMGRNSVAKCGVSEVVCDRALLGSRLYSGHICRVESEMGMWLDGEGVGQGRRPDLQGS